MTGCASHAPVDVSSCRLDAVGPDRVAFTANLHSLVDQQIQDVRVAVWMSGDKTPDDEEANESIDYDFDGPLPPHRWVTRHTSKTPEEQAFRVDRTLGSIKDCSVNAVLYRDNTMWFRRMPDL